MRKRKKRQTVVVQTASRTTSTLSASGDFRSSLTLEVAAWWTSAMTIPHN